MIHDQIMLSHAISYEKPQSDAKVQASDPFTLYKNRITTVYWNLQIETNII